MLPIVIVICLTVLTSLPPGTKYRINTMSSITISENKFRKCKMGGGARRGEGVYLIPVETII